jgi:hypothetical protein
MISPHPAILVQSVNLCYFHITKAESETLVYSEYLSVLVIQTFLVDHE